MSELDLGSTPTAPAAPAAAAPGALVLTPPAPVVVVKEEQAVGAVPLEDAKQVELRTKATAFVAELTAIDAKSPAFSQKVASITSMGEQDMRAAATVSSRMLDRPAAIVQGKNKGDAQTRVTAGQRIHDALFVRPGAGGDLIHAFTFGASADFSSRPVQAAIRGVPNSAKAFAPDRHDVASRPHGSVSCRFHRGNHS